MTKFQVVAPSGIFGGSAISEIEVPGNPFANVENAWSAWVNKTANHVSWGVREWIVQLSSLQLAWEDEEGNHYRHDYGSSEYRVRSERHPLPPQQPTLPFESDIR